MRVTELSLVGAAVLAVLVTGLLAVRWRRSAGPYRLDEWGLGGRRHGAWASWVVIGATLFGGYAFVAAPALAYAEGASAFHLLAFLIVAFPLLMLPLVRLWSVSRARGYLTAADFVRGRYGSMLLTLLVAGTGLVAAVPLLALQFVAIGSVTAVAGFDQDGIVRHLPLLVPFAVLLVLTGRPGLRGPALVSFGKVILSFLVVFVALLYLPIKLDGWAKVFTEVPQSSLLLDPSEQLHYVTLALGSALALFLYPHAVTSVLACRDRDSVKRATAGLPVFTLLLAVLMLLGFAAVAAQVVPLSGDPVTVAPQLFGEQTPSWFAGLAFAAITLSALVTASVLAIGAGNLWARSVYRHYLRGRAGPVVVEAETRQARLAATVVSALGLLLATDGSLAMDLHVIGGVVLLQTLPAVLLPLYSRWLHVRGLVLGWFAGVGYAAFLLYDQAGTVDGRLTVTAYPVGELRVLGSQPFEDSPLTIYTGVVALLFNLVVAIVVTLVLRIGGARNGRDETRPADYEANAYDPALRPV